MNHASQIIGLLLLAGILVMPASAFSISRLAMNIEENGDAAIAVDYSLSWIEQAVVFMRIAHPGQQLQQALEEYSDKEVQVISVDPGSTTLYVDEFAKLTNDPGGIIYTTPAINLSVAEQQAKNYWFSRFVTVDASPGISVITFSDGYQEEFLNLADIPSVSHQTRNYN